MRGARRGEPEPGGVGRNADHGAAGHEVADGVGPPGVVVPLVHQVLPGHQLQQQHAFRLVVQLLLNLWTMFFRYFSFDIFREITFYSFAEGIREE